MRPSLTIVRRIGTETARKKLEEDVFKSIIDEFEARMTSRQETHPDADVREVFKSIILRFAQRTPEELERAMVAGGLRVTAERGVIYNLLADRWQLSDDMDVDYMMVAAREGQV